MLHQFSIMNQCVGDVSIMKNMFLVIDGILDMLGGGLNGLLFLVTID